MEDMATQVKADRQPMRMMKSVRTWLSRYCVLVLLMALFIIGSTGIQPATILMLWITVVLCACAMKRKSITIDWTVLIAFVIYNVFSIASSFYYNETADIWLEPTQIVNTVVYIVMATLTDDQRMITRRFCGIAGGLMAGYSIIVYMVVQLWSVGNRLRGFLNSPNAYGIFLVLCWFALLGTRPKRTLWLEPLLLTGIALTLSMSSFLSLAVGIIVMCLISRRKIGTREACRLMLWRIARVVVAVAIGVCVYTCARLIRAQWLIWSFFGYLVIACLNWRSFVKYLKKSSLMTWFVVAIGVALAGTVLFLRSSASATFVERVQMMGSGIKYTFENPVLGLGPMRWSNADYYDGGLYFGVSHVHNFFLAAGSELGLIAMCALVFIAVRFFVKPGDAAVKGEGAAFLAHSMLDTAGFFAAVAMTLLLSASRPQILGKRVPMALMRIVLGVYGLVCLIQIFN